MNDRMRVAAVGVSSVVGLGGLTLGPLETPAPRPPALVIPANPDLNGDAFVDGADLSILLGGWGDADADLNGDGTTDGGDLGVLLAMWSGDATVREIVVVDALHASPVPVPVGSIRAIDDNTGWELLGWSWRWSRDRKRGWPNRWGPVYLVYTTLEPEQTGSAE